MSRKQPAKTIEMYVINMMLRAQKLKSSFGKWYNYIVIAHQKVFCELWFLQICSKTKTEESPADNEIIF